MPKQKLARKTDEATLPSGNPLLLAAGARVRSLREGQNRTRRELSQASGLSERFLAQLEAGSGNISLTRLSALCRALGTSVGTLLRAIEADPAPLSSHHRPAKNGQPVAGTRAGATRKSALAANERGAELHELQQLVSRLAPEELREALEWSRARFGRARGPMVALLGLRGAGKSTIGRALAQRLGAPFIELDKRVEAAAGLSLAGIFSLHGEEYYRRLAREVLARLLNELDAAVIATGGSIVTDREALRLLNSRCRTVWLQATAEDHWRRVLAQGDERPSAASANARAELRALLQARAPLYAQAELSVDTSRLGVAGAVDAIARSLELASNSNSHAS